MRTQERNSKAVNGVKNYLAKKGVKPQDVEVIVATYGAEFLEADNFNDSCEEIQKDFGHFVKWLNQRQKEDRKPKN